MTQPEKLEHILNGASAYFGIPREDWTKKSGSRSNTWRKKRYLIPLLYDYTDSTWFDIMRLLGYNQHGTIKFHYDNLKEEISGEFYSSPKTKMVYKELLEYLKLQ